MNSLIVLYKAAAIKSRQMLQGIMNQIDNTYIKYIDNITVER